MDTEELQAVIDEWRLPAELDARRGVWEQRGAVAQALSILDMYRTAAEASHDAELESEEPD